MKLDVKISYWELACMKHRGVPINDLLLSAIKLKENGISVKMKDLELHRKSGGRIANVVNILLNAKKKKIELTYHQAAIMDMDELNKQKKTAENNKLNSVQTKETTSENTQATDEQPKESASDNSTTPNEQTTENCSETNSDEKTEKSQ